jgi:hypothetical protein
MRMTWGPHDSFEPTRLAANRMLRNRLEQGVGDLMRKPQSYVAANAGY